MSTEFFLSSLHILICPFQLYCVKDNRTGFTVTEQSKSTTDVISVPSMGSFASLADTRQKEPN